MADEPFRSAQEANFLLLKGPWLTSHFGPPKRLWLTSHFVRLKRPWLTSHFGPLKMPLLTSHFVWLMGLWLTSHFGPSKSAAGKRFDRLKPVIAQGPPNDSKRLSAPGRRNEDVTLPSRTDAARSRESELERHAIGERGG